MSQLQKFFRFTLFFGIFIFGWEYVGLRFSSPHVPSFVLKLISSNAEIFFRNVGYYFAYLSMILTYISLKDLKMAAMNLINPFTIIFTFPHFIYLGYMEKYNTLDDNDKPLLIVGSFMWLALFSYLFAKFILSKTTFGQKLLRNLEIQTNVVDENYVHVD